MNLLSDEAKPEQVAPAGKSASMDLVALVFLDNPLARKLAVAWVTCAGDEDSWLDTAGIARSDREDAMQLCFALRKHNICQDGGKTADAALTYVRAIAAAPLNKTKGGSSRGRSRR